jgi:CRISPR-associated protein Csb2
VLLLEVRLLEPRWHGGAWPPSPARLFQALVAGAFGGRWAGEETGGDRSEAEAALRWLEALPPPRIAAPAGRPGQTVLHYVPNNSLDRKGGDPARVSEIRTAKSLSPRLFDTPPTLLYAWTLPAGEAGPQAHAATLCRLAERLHTLGRGIDPAFARAEVLDWAAVEQRLETSGLALYRPTPGGGGIGGVEILCPAPGTLDSLHRRHAAHLGQYSAARAGRSVVIDFRRPPKALLTPVAYGRRPIRRLYELRDDDGALVAWPLTRAVALAERVRDRLAGLLSRRLPGPPDKDGRLVERLVIGRGAAATDMPLRPRLIPLPSVGMAHTDPSIRRLLLEVPPDCPIPAAELTHALSGLDLTEFDPETGAVVGGGLLLHPAEGQGMARHYRIPVDRVQGGRPPGGRTADGGENGPPPGRAWHTITPALLPAPRSRAGRRRGHGARATGSDRLATEAAAIQAVRQALRHAGIDPAGALIRVQREPWTTKGARADAFTLPTRSMGSPRRGEELWHVAIRLDRPVIGPLVIGDGRWLGLGLMRPGGPLRAGGPLRVIAAPLPAAGDATGDSAADGAEDRPADGAGDSAGHETAAPGGTARAGNPAAPPPALPTALPPDADILVFPIRPGRRPPVDDAEAVVEALRRALMSRARLPDGGLPLLFSGHQQGPGPARPGHHAHVFLAAEDADGDGRLDRLLVIAPWRADRTWTPDRDQRGLFRRVAAPLRRIKAGPLGILDLDPPRAAAGEHGSVWTSLTPYSPTRHPKGAEPDAHIIADVTAECRRRGLPIPVSVAIDRMTPGPRGGLTARLTLRFATPVPGPLLLGRTAHSGGGWFAAVAEGDGGTPVTARAAPSASAP